jgi:hypothetical protein
MKEICKCQLVLIFVLLAKGMNAQVIIQGDTAFFGPGLMYVGEKGLLPLLDNHSDLLAIGPGGSDLVYYIEYFDFYNEANLLYNSQRCSLGEEEGNEETIEEHRMKSIQQNGFTYSVNKNYRYGHHERNKGNRKRIGKYYSISIDTVLFQSVRVKMVCQSVKMSKIRKGLKLLENIYLVNPEQYPANNFCLANDSISDREIIDRFETKNLLTALPCASAEMIKEDFPDYYGPEIDSMFNSFAYSQIADSLEARFFRKKKREWNCHKHALTYLYEGKDVSVQKEIQMHRKLFKLEVGINEFMNYKKQLSQTTFFDTIDLIRFRQRKLAPVIQPFNSLGLLYEDCKRAQSYSFRDIFSSEIYLKIEPLLYDYLIRKYFGGSEIELECVLLFSDNSQEFYGVQSLANPPELRFLTRIYQETMGNWNVKIDTLENLNTGYSIDSLFYLNGAISFATGSDFLIVDSDNQTKFIQSFPDSLPGLNYIAHVQSAEELFDDHFENEFFVQFPNNDYRKNFSLGYSIQSDYSSWIDFNKNDYARNESIFLHKSKGDIDGDGAEEIYSYGISAGKVIFVKGYSSLAGKLIELKEPELLRKLSGSVLFNNIILYSQINNGNK